MIKFSTREDVEAPIGYVFDQMSNFHAIERSALRRGVEMQRIDKMTRIGPGMAWDVAFTLRGKQREMQAKLTEFDPPNGLRVESKSQTMGGQLFVDLVALSRGRTRMSMEIELKPKTLSARLLIQSLKLARSNLSRRFRDRVAGYAKHLEERYKAQA